MIPRELRGVVEQDGEGFVGRCDEVGSTSWGASVEEAFTRLREATWSALGAGAGTMGEQGVLVEARAGKR